MDKTRRALVAAVFGALGMQALPAQARGLITEKDRNKLSPQARDFFTAAQALASAEAADAEIAGAGRWIEIRLASQRLVAWQNGRAVLTTAMSSGTIMHPTVRGSFRIGRKYSAVRMTGPGYDLPNVPFAMFFYQGYAIHGTYWHTAFGRPMSHGCINVPTDKARWLFQWAPAGTLVVVH